VAALLETVDLELERLAAARDDYVAGLKDDPEVALNVDSLRGFMDRRLPHANKDTAGGEDYAELLPQVIASGVRSLRELEDLLDRNWLVVLDREEKLVQDSRQDVDKYGGGYGVTPERVAAGVYFSHVGLVRLALRADANGGVL